jgi:Baseplate J-like protein
VTTQVSTIPVSVDYTSRDYYSIRDQLIKRIQARIPSWTATDPADFGVAFVEAMAYMGDLISYYIDRNANENSIYTATQRNSVLNIAQTFGYIPAGYRQSYVNLTFYNSGLTDQLIPAGTVVSGQVTTGDVVQTLYFTTNSSATVVAGTSNAVLATEGQFISLVSPTALPTYGELIGTSDGSPNQSYMVLHKPVIDGSIDIFVQDGDIYSQWTQVQHLTDYGSSDLIYTTYSDENNNIFITFGDGVSGAIPVPYSQIRATYIVGGGDVGNIGTNIATNISYVPGLTDSQVTALKGTITVTNNTSAIAGSDPESTDQIRISAPASLRSANRAVTLKDFADLALSVNNVGKANAAAAVWTSVTLYIAPTRNAGTTDLQPGLNPDNSASSEYTTLAANVSSYMANKLLIGSSLTIQPPTYVDVVLSILYALDPKYKQSDVTNSILTTLNTKYGYNGVSFQETIYPQDIESALNGLPGVKTVRVNALYRYGVQISSAAASGTAITYTTSAPHGLSVGSTVTVAGFTPSGYNVTSASVATVADLTHFTVASTQSSGTATGTGSFTAYSTLVGSANELFRFQVSNINIGTM